MRIIVCLYKQGLLMSAIFIYTKQTEAMHSQLTDLQFTPAIDNLTLSKEGHSMRAFTRKSALAFRNKEPISQYISEFNQLVSNNKKKLNTPMFYAKCSILHEVAKWAELTEYLKILAKNEVDFSAQEEDHGNTPLMWAVANGCNGMAKEILTQLP